MTTPQDFLGRFLKDKTAAWATARSPLTSVYEKYFGEPLLQQADGFMTREMSAVVEDVKLSNGSATAVTRESLRTADLRTRYRLAAEGGSWKIVGIDRECFMCHGTGQLENSRCHQ